MPTSSPAARSQKALGVTAAVLGILAFLAPIWPSVAVAPYVGGLLVVAASLEIFHGLRRPDDRAQRAAFFGGGLTLLIGIFLLHAPLLAARAMNVFVLGSFVVDGIRYLISAISARRGGRPHRSDLLAAAGNLGVAAVMVLLRTQGIDWTLAFAGGTRILGTAWNILRSAVYTAEDVSDTTIRDLGLQDNPHVREISQRLEEAELRRGPVDRGWIIVLLVTLFSIHIGRMGLDRSVVGILSPTVALIGDMVVALVVTFLILTPVRLALRKLTRPLERKAWRWYLNIPALHGKNPVFQRLVGRWLTGRLTFAVRLRQSRYSLRSAMVRGLRLGLPFAAILAATIPVWGMSWYFDTENWAAGVWDSWAAARTDTWRTAMIRALSTEVPVTSPSSFAVTPPGVGNGTDFSFIVIGDPGEGDASQHVLRDQILAVDARPDVRFLVISSDVVYPDGAMKDYEAKFWLPFKGVTKPVYAIPGNHDWYDALEGFAATFLKPDAARSVMRARIEADLRLTGTTEAHVEELVQEAARLRREYRVPTGFQHAPFFKMQTDRFLLLAIDTGVLRTVDSLQLLWLRSTLDAARGKFIMAIVGHPFYAIGEYQGGASPGFAALHRLLKDHGVRIIMAGDTHDLEYYIEPADSGDGEVHHFVNGGGGAYLSLGAALTKPERMPTRVWAHYPATGPIVNKVAEHTPWWKAPAWYWTRQFNGWPFSAEWLSAAFDYNVAPFFQSFVEVRVEQSSGIVRIIPYGPNGRLRWEDLEMSDGVRPEGVPADAAVEWRLPMQ